MGSRATAPGGLSGSHAGPVSLEPIQLQAYERQALVNDYSPFATADRGRPNQPSVPASYLANGGMQQAGTAAAALGGVFPGAGSGQAGAAAFAGGGRLQRSASAPLAKRHPGSPEEPPSDQVLARLQRTQQELQRQRAEQAEWAAAAQQLLRARGHAVPQAGPPQHAQQQQQRSGTLPPLHPQAGQQRRAASLDLQPGHDLGQAFSSLQASLGAIQQQQQGWEARRAAHQAERAQQQAQWETMRAAEQWGWEMQRQAEERAWRQAQRQQEEAWQDKRRQEEGQWLERRRGEEQAQQARQQRAQQHWQMECRAAQLPQPAAPEQRQVAAPEQRQLPPVRDFYTQPPPMGMPPSSLPPQYSPSEGGGGSSGSSSAAAAPPLPAVLEEPDSMQMDLLSLDSVEFMEMARELGVASPAPNFDLLLADVQQAQRGPLGGGGGLGPISPVPQPFSALPAQQLAGPAPGQPQPAGLAQRQQQQVQHAQQQAASRPASF